MLTITLATALGKNLLFNAWVWVNSYSMTCYSQSYS